MQDYEIGSRPLNVTKLKTLAENKTSGEPFSSNDLEAINNAVDALVDDDTHQASYYN